MNKALAHELWAAAQLAPDEGIEDGVARILDSLPKPEPFAWFYYSDKGERYFCDDPGYMGLRQPLYTTPPDQSARIAELERERDMAWSINSTTSEQLLRGKIAELERENEELRKDAERLDWLESQSGYTVIGVAKAANRRQAIDAAIAGAKEKA